MCEKVAYQMIIGMIHEAAFSRQLFDILSAVQSCLRCGAVLSAVRVEFSPEIWYI